MLLNGSVVWNPANRLQQYSDSRYEIFTNCKELGLGRIKSRIKSYERNWLPFLSWKKKFEAANEMKSAFGNNG
jgi:hypothetical protein